ncbi:hypothetical protein C7M61_004020 [Candidozyma pseudohaemuli]|uniref:beta-glucosidase n=1 Tax=Candidozyma pseudohaemuli TaxID=418784 RepID=A0A2P7YKP9_9ASCO|nr:hypothetical protein C7M61_004020 [[Candida] pseudohaemulonii]PSK36547.1 hypothetical protein C7M61_004020 [[Candida] pseudohaemulonii]
MEFKKIDIESVLDQLTLHEKINLVSGRDSWHTYAVHRLGIPSLRISDGPNGVRGTKFFNSVATACIPTGTSLGCCWNTDLMYDLGKMMGEQCRAKGAHVLMGPNINMVRNPLCGRSFETLGEDPILSGLLALAYCQGVHDTNIMICPKHMVCNDKEDYRMTMNVLISERALREIYLMPFMLVQKYANPEMYMTAYNRLNGSHCNENPHLMKDIVRKEWGFEGAFVSDWYGTVSCADSINAGLDLEMPGPSIWRGKLLEMSIFHDTVTQKSLDDAVRGVLYLVNKAAESGIPEDAYEGLKDDDATAKIVLQAARESIVLMKNSNDILPLKKNRKVLVIGEAAKKANFASGGCTNVKPYRQISLYDSLVERFGDSNVTWCLGASNRKLLPSFSLFAKSKEPSPIQYCVYDDPRSVPDRRPITEEKVGEIDAMLGDFDPAKLRDIDQLYASFLVVITVPESGLYKVNLKVSGLARVYIDGKLKMVNDLEHKTSGAFGLDAPEILEEIHLEAGKDYLFEVDFESTIGKSSFITGYGCVTCGIEKAISPEESIKEAATLAKSFDQVIVITGLNKDYECEGFDRKNMDLPPYQDKLIESVLASNPDTVVVIESGTPVTLPWLDKCSTLLHSGYIGEQLGNALADVLYGDYNPSARLSYTWPKRYEDSSSATSFTVDKRYSLTYLDDIYMGYRHMDYCKIKPLFAFGHGLSYTSFKFSDLKLEVNNTTVSVCLNVTNTGTTNGSTIVQIYVGQNDCSVPCPIKSMKGFKNVYCRAGEVVSVKVDINKRISCSYFDTSLSQWTLEKGTYEVMVGSSSDLIELTSSFDIEKTTHWLSLKEA